MTSSLSSNPVIAEERPTETSTDLTVNSLSTEAPEKKVRKAYTITKSRESWTEGEHDKFLEALQLFDRDWKKIEDFVGSKTVIQIRSHAQKYFLKVEKNGTLAHVPPPRPKRKAAHPYPQKASKNAQMSLHVSMSFPTQINNVPGYTSWDDDTSALLNIAYVINTLIRQGFDRDWKKIEDFVGSKTVIQIRSHAQKYFLKVEKNGTLAHVPPPRPKRKAAHPYPQKASKNAQMSLHVSMSFPTQINNVPGYTSWDDDTSALLNIALLHMVKVHMLNMLLVSDVIESNGSTSEGSPSASCIASSSRTVSDSKTANQAPSMHGLPDFAEVYNFIGSVFDPDSKGRMKKLKEMDPINFETVLLLMRNLTVNLSNPDFEPAGSAGPLVKNQTSDISSWGTSYSQQPSISYQVSVVLISSLCCYNPHLISLKVWVRELTNRLSNLSAFGGLCQMLLAVVV
ncbi:hypothetical protein F2Q68_00023506 [Brassica cretica]|uniref:Protein REVEILLE 8 n=1 Tax=Brassica cretica TaxID=69181 RepID=A0A8S9FTT9_BRACR|nr:hypothetical protein F2Q68_00023506 [Brassica cretica]